MINAVCIEVGQKSGNKKKYQYVVHKFCTQRSDK